MGEQEWMEEYRSVRKEAKKISRSIEERHKRNLKYEKRYKRPKLSELHAKLEKIESGRWEDPAEAILYLDEAKHRLHEVKMMHSLGYRVKCKILESTELLPSPWLSEHRSIPDPKPHNGDHVENTELP